MRPEPVLPDDARLYRAVFERSLGINVNLGWGLVMLLFGAVFLLSSRRRG